MAITEKDYDSIVNHIQSILKGHIYNMGENQAGINCIGVDEQDIEELQKLVPYKQYTQTVKKSKKAKPEVSKEVKEWLEILWKFWPATSNWQYGNIKFSGDRNLRGKKEDALKALNRAIQGGARWIDVYHGACIEISSKKKESLRKEENKLQYLPLISSWLNMEGWKVWEGVEIEEVKSKPVVTEVSI